MPSDFPTTSQRIGIREYIDIPEQPFMNKSNKFRSFCHYDEPSCFKKQTEQTYTTSHQDHYRDPAIKTGNSTRYPEIATKAAAIDNIQYVQPMGLTSEPSRSAARWISRSHETYTEPIPEPPVQRVLSRLSREPAIVPVGTMLETGSPVRPTTNQEHYQEPTTGELSQHLLRCKTSAPAVDPLAGTDSTIAKPKDDPIPAGFVYLRQPTGDRQVLEVVDAMAPPAPERNTKEVNPLCFPQPQSFPFVKRGLKTTYQATMTEPLVDHERVIRNACAGPSRSPPRYNVPREEMQTIPRVFNVAHGEPTIDRKKELQARHPQPKQTIPRSKLTSVQDTFKDYDRFCHQTGEDELFNKGQGEEEYYE